MDDLVERPAVWPVKGPQRTTGRTAKRDLDRAEPVVRATENLACVLLVGDVGVPVADAEVRGGQDHRHRGLAQVELRPAALVSVLLDRHHQDDRRHRAGDVPGALPDLGVPR